MTCAVCPPGPTGHENVKYVSVDVFRAAHLFTFGPRGQGISLRGSRMISKNRQKIGKDNGMPSLPTWPTQVTKTENVGYVGIFRAAHLFTFGPRG